jgi:hypothetical protein
LAGRGDGGGIDERFETGEFDMGQTQSKPLEARADKKPGGQKRNESMGALRRNRRKREL